MKATPDGDTQPAAGTDAGGAEIDNLGAPH